MRRAVARLRPAAFRAFVADCWAARGYETTREGALLSVRRRGHRRTVLLVHDVGLLGRAPSPPDGRTVDVVVAADPDLARALAARHDARARGPAALRGTLRYALDRPVADRLCRHHLGRSLDAVDRQGRLAARLPWNVAPRTAGAVCLLVAAVAAAVVVPAVGAGLADGPTGGAAAGGLGAAGGGTGPAVGSGEAGTGPAVGGAGRPAEAHVDGALLARAHRNGLAGRPRTVTGRVDEAVDGPDADPTVERVAWRARVAGPTRFRYRLVGAREVANGRLQGLSERVYADGQVRYELEGRAGSSDGVRTTPVGSDGGAGEFAARTAAHVRRHLDGARVVGTVRRNGTVGFRLRRDTPPADVAGLANYTARAVVGVDGVVREFAVRYEVETLDGREPVTVAFAYDLGPTRVTSPAWATAATNATT